MTLKQVILVRQDLKLPKGKLAAQVAHGSLSAYLEAAPRLRDAWLDEGGKKIVLKVKDLGELDRFGRAARRAGLAVSRITDAGHTVVAAGTVTVCAIGPANEEDIDRITGDLSMLS